MKKWISLLLALLMAFSVLAVTALAEDPEEPEGAEKKFVIDGQLDEWYRDDEWAVDNGFYYYFKGMDDTMLDVISKDPKFENGQMDLPSFDENVEVYIYVAYDDHYAYFYVDVYDENIADRVVDADGNEVPGGDGKPQQFSQYIENIDFYVDTDPGSCDGKFFENEASKIDADTHFRMIAHNMWIGDCQGATTAGGKYTLAEETDNDPASYFKNQANVMPFQHKDESGKLIGFGCEARFPLAYYYGNTDYTDVYFNIAVCQHVTKDHIVCAITTGKRWWLAYDTGKTVSFDEESILPENNPFFNKPDFDVVNAAAFDAAVEALPAPADVKRSDAKAIEAARALYEKLTERGKELATKLADLEAVEEAFNALPDPDVEAAAAVESAIDALPAAADVTPDDEEAINGARNAYNALNDKAKSMVKNLKKLTDAEEALAAQMVRGDVNGDKTTDARDALLVLKAAVGKEKLTDAQKKVADLNGDQLINATDALVILKIAVGKA